MSEAGRSQPRGFEDLVRSAAASIRRAFHDHVPLYACAVAFCLATLGAAYYFRLPVPLEAGTYFLVLALKFILMGVCALALIGLLLLYRGERPVRPLPALMRWLGERLLAGDRFGNVFHSVVAFTPLMIAFAAFKDEVPKINPFSWDPVFMTWSRAIGFGRLPWQILQPVLGHAPITVALSFAYESWFVVMFGCFFWQAFSSRRSVVRSQYLLAFSFSWFLAGGVIAAFFSSAGPCFYGHLYPGDNPYAAQMRYLHDVARQWPLWSVHIQDLLWQSYVTGSGEVSGISAMPSMHIETSVLMAILGWHANRRLGAALTAFAGLMVIGSIHLAWHYIVDDIAGAAIAFAFWYGAGALIKATQRYVAPAPAALASAA